MKSPDLPYNAILCRYSEIGTKGRNRHIFEKMLVANIRKALRGMGPVLVKRVYGRIFITPVDGDVFSGPDVQHLRQQIPHIFGLVSASPAILVRSAMDDIESAVEQTFPPVYEAFAAAEGRDAPVRYAMRTRRNNPSFPLHSNDVEVYFADRLLTRYPRLKVDLRNPQLRVAVEIRRGQTFISYETISGPGGLPTGSGGRIVAMLSGGIDSPVACYQMMRRGCRVHFVTFHSSPYTPPETVHKVARIAEVLKSFQAAGALFAVNLLAAQKAIRDHCSDRFRTLLYRRMMVRICEEIGRQLGCIALCTGDNLGQVASQTLPNLLCITDAADGMILRPLIGMDKAEIMAVARHIGTFEISKEDVPDSCTVFAPQSPATNAPLDRVVEEEKRLDVHALVKASLAVTTVVDPATLEQRPAEWH